MFQSIIIPCRNWNGYLRHCLWSIERSAEIYGRSAKNYEVIVVDDSSDEAPPLPKRGRVLRYSRSEPFNKPRLLNGGIDEAQGDILTFLDADAIVAPRWMEAADRLARFGPMALTKLCYRVRLLPKEYLATLEAATFPAILADEWFAKYDTYPAAFEGYVDPETDGKDVPGREPVFGNSQFSIARMALGELRFNEDYAGRGFEDIWLSREIWRHYGKEYRAGIVTDPEHAMFHIRNRDSDSGKDWGPGQYSKANFQRYHST